MRFIICFDPPNMRDALWLQANCWTADVKGANIDQVITNFVDIDLQTKMLHFT